MSFCNFRVFRVKEYCGECIGRAISESYFSGALHAKICLGMPRESILGVILTAQPSLSIVQHR